jgi:mono/diheme cytochrome c family protein
MTSFRRTALAGLACALLIGAATADDKPATPATAAAPATTAAKDGKTLFLENKCNTCHTIQAAGIEKRKASAEDTAEATAKEASKPEKKPPDLSSVGLDQKPEWIAKYLMKTESLKGEKHGRKFRGTEPELKTVSQWLGSMKTPKKK